MKKCNSILIVEDDKDIAESLSELLKDVTEKIPAVAHNGEEALELIHVLDKPCLVLLDLMMPIMDGFTFISKIKEVGMEGVAHIVIITAASRVTIEGKRVLKKPFDITALFNTIKDVCHDMPRGEAV